jgi:hypothetical protein
MMFCFRSLRAIGADEPEDWSFGLDKVGSRVLTEASVEGARS